MIYYFRFSADVKENPEWAGFIRTNSQLAICRSRLDQTFSEWIDEEEKIYVVKKGDYAILIGDKWYPFV